MPRLGCTPSSPVPPIHNAGLRRLARRFAPALATFVVAVLGCREDAQSPLAPEATPLATTSALAFYQVSAGYDHRCGVTTDNRAYCWGGNSEGQLGDGTTTSTDNLRPVAVAGTLRFRQISASFTSTCGVTTNYRAYCWGTNERGQLGDGTTTGRLKPVPVAGGRQFRQVETSFQHTCGVTYPTNRVYCWGNNPYGQLGNGTRDIRLTPVAVSGGLSVRQVSAGYNHTCAVTTDDRVFCWGWNRYGQVGDGSTAWLHLKPSAVAGTRHFRQVDAGRDQSCAVTIGYRAFCWGYNFFGELGNGTTAPSRVPTAVAGGFSFERVSAGALHTCAETTLNRAYCWGSGGVLGDGTTTTRHTPVAVTGGLRFNQVSAGSGTCGKTPEGVAYCWGIKPVPVGDPM
jgi:alpha-tubulin suppressor-like RCC1 family protein